MPSIHPQHIATSSAWAAVTVGTPESFLYMRSQISLARAWFFSSQVSNAAWVWKALTRSGSTVMGPSVWAKHSGGHGCGVPGQCDVPFVALASRFNAAAGRCQVVESIDEPPLFRPRPVDGCPGFRVFQVGGADADANDRMGYGHVDLRA